MNLQLEFNAPINSESVMNLRNLITKQEHPVEWLTFNIHSLGGSVADAIYLYNYLKHLPFKIATHNAGEVTSAAVIVYLAGNTRTAEKVSKFVIHPIKMSANGDYSYVQIREILLTLDADIKNYASIVNAETDSMCGVYSVEDCLKGTGAIVLDAAAAYKCGIVTQM